MRIEKWYLDSVTPKGAGMIGYAARIGAGPLSIHCVETLRWNPGDLAAQHRFALGGKLPRETAEGVAWHCRTAEAEGRWRRRQAGLATVTLYEEPAGRIAWTCFCPAADSTVTVDGQSQVGSGYAERLTLTLPVARLPFRELRWGRFIAEMQNCLWIEWQGAKARRWCFHNGDPVDATAPDRHGFAWNGHRLRLDSGITLRSGCVLETAFGEAGPLRWLLPRAIRGIQETKWCSAGVLTDNQGREHTGWAIHEVAYFP